MSIDALKEYLEIAIDMEQSIFLMQSFLRDLNTQIEQMQVPAEFPDPRKPISPTAADAPYAPPHTAGAIVIRCVGLFFLAGLIGLVARPLFLSAGLRDVFDVLYSLAVFGIPIAYICYCSSKNKRYSAEHTRQVLSSMDEYNRQLSAYEAAIQTNQQFRRQDEANRHAKTQLLEREKQSAEQTLAETTARLHTIYEQDIIFPKYRSLPMLCSIYEYLCAGLCATLTGPYGAYMILEREIQMSQIVTRLDHVIDSLDRIAQGQSRLYAAIQESNHRSAAILDSTVKMADSMTGLYHSTEQMAQQSAQITAQIQRLQETSALTAYHAERAQKELAYMNKINYLSGRNDDVFFNQPPT